jgi:hypothetical protein
MNIIHLSEAIRNLRPGAKHYIIGGTYEGIQWIDEVQSKPTKQEVETEIQRIENNIANFEYINLRKKEYPPIEDYLDGIVKGDTQQVQNYIDACLAVKTKYPKPV